jgi:glycosyltransferase involved in cell wall biosynthesis
MKAAPLSAVILAYNEEVNIRKTLESLSGWVGEIWLVDSGSSDATTRIARGYTENVVDHPYTDHASQWTWALAQLPLAHEWVLLVDSDFVFTPHLRDLITVALDRVDPAVAGFYVMHRYVFRGKPICFGGTKKWWLRVVRRGATAIDRSEMVDFRVIAAGRTERLSGLVLEDNLKEYDIDFWIDKHQKFSSRMAIEEVLRREGALNWAISPNLFGNPDERIVWLKQKWYGLPLYVRPLLYFLYRFFLRLGFLDGVQGAIFHFLQGFWFRLIVDIKMAKIYESLRSGQSTLEDMRRDFLR